VYKSVRVRPVLKVVPDLCIVLFVLNYCPRHEYDASEDVSLLSVR
jgi:hypothetical protein